MVGAFCKGAFEPVEQFRPLLLQQQAPELGAQLGARGDQPRLAAGLVRRRLGQRVPAHAAHEAVRSQIALRLLAQEGGHLARAVEQVARGGDVACGQRQRRRGRDGLGAGVMGGGRFHAALEAAEEGVERRPRGFRPLRGAFEDQRQRRQRALQRQPGQPVHAVEPVRERGAGEPFERRLAAFGPGGQQLRAEAIDQRRQQLEAGRDALRTVPPHARIDIVGGEPGILGSALEQALRRLDDQGVVDIRQLGDFVLDGEEVVVIAGVVPGRRVGADGPQPRFPSRDGRPGQIRRGARTEQRVEQLVKHRSPWWWMGGACRGRSGTAARSRAARAVRAAHGRVRCAAGSGWGR